jgi:hypothetical protein
VDQNEFLGIQEYIYLRIIDRVAGFAFPTQTTYDTRDAASAEERAQAAEGNAGCSPARAAKAALSRVCG